VFLPLLIASGDGVLVNTSRVNGFWASLDPGAPQTAYSAAKFGVRGFSEALIEDLRVIRSTGSAGCCCPARRI
jgi:NAD(P)-dependent dehydrogenase (short-subunit alcohol dehydrogenase family)